MEYTLVLRGRKFIQRSSHSKYSLHQVNVNKSNLIEIAFRDGCSPVILLHIFRTPFPGWLLLARVSFLIKLSAILLKIRLCHKCFSVTFARFLRTSSIFWFIVCVYVCMIQMLVYHSITNKQIRNMLKRKKIEKNIRDKRNSAHFIKSVILLLHLYNLTHLSLSGNLI